MAKTASTKETPVSTEEETPVRLEGDQWVFLIDPSWQAEAAEKSEGADPEKPPLEAVLGGWFVEESGVTSRFHANPSYEPTTPDSPTDPVDAVLRLVVRGESEPDQLLDVMAESVFGLAVNAENTPVVVMSPDDVPCVIAATAPAHSRRIAEVEGLQDVEAWAEVNLGQLVGVLPDEGVDVLLNPGASSSMRLIAATLREVAAKTADTTTGETAAPTAEA
ncbi:type VII secretion system-associated protein [Lentzea sp. NEAU-D13]|uniref:Type VII secretion system-associated protein n=1 Tax=Lentzea alba TaxID=2714351 RepID=A0A7C9W0S2_9PSEU|nr:type VII secretion system-associated protein [Lentzea alba]NGY63441.1 type VII secretion system-associated protein [Lentzea alba]